MELEPTLEIRAPRRPIDPQLARRLREALADCPDVAFAHLPEVYVPGRQPRPELVLFVWLVPGALGSLRSSLNLVSDRVAGALPDDDYLDVVILNSAPELLAAVEDAGSLLVERDAGEHLRAVEAARAGGESPGPARRPWWWPFG